MAEPRDDFYVGYLPMPASHLRFVRIAVPSLLWVMVLAGVLVALLQRSPGDAVWDQARPVTREGVLIERPYPYIIAGDTAVFLVEQSKRGAQERTRGMDGRMVRITGWRLERDGREILELVPEAGAVAPASHDSVSAVPTRDLGPATLRGEILDYKCYLGAMKPGDGKAHKACAILCLTGGIPAMLVTKGPEMRPTVLASADGGPLNREFIELAGEPVVVQGNLMETGPVRILRVSAVRRP